MRFWPSSWLQVENANMSLFVFSPLKIYNVSLKNKHDHHVNSTIMHDTNIIYPEKNSQQNRLCNYDKNGCRLLHASYVAERRIAGACKTVGEVAEV